jgi:hypothetical protein
LIILIHIASPKGEAIFSYLTNKYPAIESAPLFVDLSENYQNLTNKSI